MPNISRSKESQIMKFGQSIQYNIKIIFPEISYTKCGGDFIILKGLSIVRKFLRPEREPLS